MRSALSLGVLVALFGGGCGEGENITRLTVSGAFDPPNLDFGEVPVGLSRSLSATLINTSEAPFTIDDVEGSSSFSIRATDRLLEGAVISAGTRVQVEVSFVSISETAYTEPLIVHSGELAIPLRLSARGVIRSIPEFTVEPAILDFGSVEFGQSSRLTFAAKNVGNGNGTLISSALASGASDFSLNVPWPVIVAPGFAGIFPISFTPTHAGAFSERMLIGVNELGAPLTVELRGIAGGANGQFFCLPSAVNFEVVERGRVRSLVVSCTARGGEVQLTGSSITADPQLFVITQQPPPGLVAVEQSVSYTIEFRPDGLPLPHESSLAVQYTGAAGAATLAIPLSGEVGVPPPESNAISAILTWDTDFTDVDLHLVRPNGAIFALENDCFWASKSPDWGQLGVLADNPFLDVDDIDGFGPETINLRQAETGTYNVYAHYYADRRLGPTNASIEIYLAGSLVGIADQPNVACNDLWNVGTIQWNGSGGTFTPAGGVTQTQSGNCE